MEITRDWTPACGGPDGQRGESTSLPPATEWFFLDFLQALQSGLENFVLGELVDSPRRSS